MESTEEDTKVDRQVMTEPIKERLPHEKGESRFRQRTPVQVEAYWNDVRDALRVTDDEVYSDEYVVAPEHVERTTSSLDRPQREYPLEECHTIERSPSHDESIYSQDCTSEVGSNSASEYSHSSSNGAGSVGEYERDDTPRTSFAQSVKEVPEQGFDDETSGKGYDGREEEYRERSARMAARLVDFLRKQDDTKDLRQRQLDAPPTENTPTEVMEQTDVEEERPKAKGKAVEGGSKTWPRATARGPKKAWKKVKRALRTTQNTKTW